MAVVKIEYPYTERTIRALKAGDAVEITGPVITGRDKLHKFFADGGEVPAEFRGGCLYHCGPVVVKERGEWRVKAAGPTTSVRENPYEPAFIAKTGVRIIIGKGGMDASTLAAMKRHGCVYVQAVGGAAALAAASLQRVVKVDHLEDFGAAEACWHFAASGFRGIVAMDAHGVSLFDSVRADSAKELARLLGKS